MKTKHIVLLHGLFMNNLVMSYLANGFITRGYSVSLFQYKSKLYSPEILVDLHDHVKALVDHGSEVILVGHSMGGLIARQLCQEHPTLAKGLITLGTPHKQSKIGQLADKLGLIGTAGEVGICVPIAEWKGEIPLLSIAGNLKVGLLALDKEANDGTVRVAETMCANQTGHLVLPVSHTGIVYSKKALDAADAFISLHC